VPGFFVPGIGPVAYRVVCLCSLTCCPGGRLGLARGPGRPTREPWPAYRAQLLPVFGAQLVPVAGRAGARAWCRWPCLCLYCLAAGVCDPTYKHPGPRCLVRSWWPPGRAAWCLVAQVRPARPGPWAVARVPGCPVRVAGRMRPGAYVSTHSPRAQKKGPVAGCAGFSPFSHARFHVKQFWAPAIKGPLCQQSQLVSKYLQFQNETDFL